MSRNVETVKDMTLIAVCASILFVQEFALTFLPNIQLSALLIVLYSKVLGFKRTSLIIVIHVFLDNLALGSLNIIYFPAMLMAWLLIPALLCTVFRYLRTPLKLAVFGFFFGFIYGWMFIPFTVIATGVPWREYLIADLPFEFIMAISNFLTILWLYEPLEKALNNQKERYYGIPQMRHK